MTETFPADRRHQLFGREADIHRLTDRASQSGLTVVAAQPLMGKTWTLTEVARRLLEEGRYLVGYHASNGAESSHLLYTVSNLYVRWLDDSAMREQAISLWKRHKDGLVPRIGKMIGALFEDLVGPLLPGGVAAVVRKSVDGLAEVQTDLLSGGIQLAPLPYDQALSLIRLVAEISNRRIVLILDTWEKSFSIRAEFATLEAFLKHRDEWPHTHVFLAVRNPEVDSTRVNDEAYRRARDLCRMSRAADLDELSSMDLARRKERVRIVSFIRNSVPAAKNQTERSILEMIDGYPGVLNFWTEESKKMQTKEDLRKEAGNAQALRYVELEHLLGGLQWGQPLMLAARLAFFPRLDAEKWVIFRALLLKDQSDADIYVLIDSKVLSDERFPTYGHDTRHAAARRWFIEHKLPLFRRTSEQFIECLASRITGIGGAGRPFFEALVGCSETARQAGIDPNLRCLLDAAQSAFGDVEAISRREFDDAYPKAVQRNGSFVPLVAISLINRGFEKGDRGDGGRAVADYTAAIELPDAPADLVAMALRNRGVEKGRRHDSEGAIADYAAVIELPGAPADQVAKALVNRGVVKGGRHDSKGAIADYTAAIELPGAPADQVAKALVNRGVVKGGHHDSEGAIADFTAAIELPDAPADRVAKALVNRGVVKGGRHDSKGAIADFTAAIELPDAPADRVAKALVNRGGEKGRCGDSEGAIADYTAAIELPDAPADVVEAARRNLADTGPAPETSK